MDLNLLLVIMMFAAFIGLLFTGYPVAFVLAGVGMAFAVLGEVLNGYGVRVDADLNYLGFVVNRIYATMSSYDLVPVPLFIFMGHMLDRSGIARDLLNALRTVLGPVPGGLALAVTIIGVILAASTGIIGASVVLLCTLALPTMLDSGYQPELSVGVVSASGTLGILIPPSIMLVLMADQMTLSVGDLFMGALFPGLILAALYAVYIVGITIVRPGLAPPVADRERGAASSVASLIALGRALIPPLLLVVAVLGSIFFGIASPSEAAGVGAIGAWLLAVVNGSSSVATLREVSLATVRTTSFVFAIILGATCFSVVLRGLGGDEVIEGALRSLPFGEVGILATVLFLVFLLGFFLDWLEITLIILPLVGPLIVAFDFDPVWFTVLVAVCLQTSFLTPPVGYALFYVKAVAPKTITVRHLYRGIMPFVALQLIGLGIVAYYPELVTWLPSVAYR